MGGSHRRKRRSGKDRAGNISIDRISDLPEPIQHHILAFLPFKQVVQTSVLSKPWGLAWRTFPILDFDFTFLYQFLPGDRVGREVQPHELRDVLHYIEETLRTRHDETISINKFSLCLTEAPLKPCQPYIDRMLEDVLGSNVKELNLVTHSACSFNLPEMVLRSKSIEKLTLEGCTLKSPTNVNFKLSSLRKLCLSSVYVDGPVLEKLVAGCPLVEYLSLDGYLGLRSLELSGLTKLNEALIINRDTFQLLSIKALSIQKATLEGECRLDIASFKNLKHLKIIYVDGKDDRLSNQISKFPFLECLILKGCRNLRSFKISSLSLKSFEMCSCVGVIEVKIEAPNLSLFKYQGSVVSFSLGALTLSESHILFRTKYLHPAQYDKYIKLLAMFYSVSKVVILRSVTRTPLMIPEDLRQTQSSPLHSVDHLDCTLEDLKYSHQWRTSLIKHTIESLLWISPHLRTVSMRCGPLGLPPRSTLKFQFSYRRQPVYEGGMAQSCPVSCWRQCIEEVVIEEGNSTKLYIFKGKDIGKIVRFVKLHLERLLNEA
ncbi:hypothetical protein OROMI_030008 [Orobanche minor]